MNDPRQPSSPSAAPRPAGVPLQQGNSHPPHPQQHPHPAAAQPHHPAGVGLQPQQRPMIRPAATPTHPATGPAKIAPMPTMPRPAQNDDDAIALIEDGEDAVTLHKKIKAFGNDAAAQKYDWKRALNAHTQGGPTRVRTFHAKLSDQGLEHLDNLINHFLDDHPEIDVKSVTTNIGMFDGKFKDFALIINVWY
jgi:hypothetical protein